MKTKKRIAVAFVCVLLCVGLVGTCAFADSGSLYQTAGEQVQGAVNETSHSLYRIIRGIVAFIATIGMAWGGIKMMTSDERGVAMGKKYLLICAIGLGIVLLAPPLVRAIVNAVTSGGGGSAADSTVGDIFGSMGP